MNPVRARLWSLLLTVSVLILLAASGSALAMQTPGNEGGGPSFAPSTGAARSNDSSAAPPSRPSSPASLPNQQVADADDGSNAKSRTPALQPPQNAPAGSDQGPAYRFWGADDFPLSRWLAVGVFGIVVVAVFWFLSARRRHRRP